MLHHSAPGLALALIQRCMLCYSCHVNRNDMKSTTTPAPTAAKVFFKKVQRTQHDMSQMLTKSTI